MTIFAKKFHLEIYQIFFSCFRSILSSSSGAEKHLRLLNGPKKPDPTRGRRLRREAEPRSPKNISGAAGRRRLEGLGSRLGGLVQPEEYPSLPTRRCQERGAHRSGIHFQLRVKFGL